jgi:hypothetical protein
MKLFSRLVEHLNKMENEKYEKCKCYSNGKWESYKRHTEMDEMYKVNDLQLDTKGHLISLKVMKSYESN